MALVAILLLCGSSRAWAQDDFFRSSPGKLTKSHAALDNMDGCNECHVNGKQLSNDKCLDCHDHKDLRAQIRAGQGFHATAEVKSKKCERCHSEHRGRSFDLMGWGGHKGGQAGFDHRLAGWPLRGKHGAIDCAQCHKKKNSQGLRTFLGESRECSTCHKDEQPHKFTRQAMLRCDRCHGESVWNPPNSRLEFNHNKKSDSAFPLEGSHNDVACSKCHPRAKFNLGLKDPENCAECHNSPHDNHLFGKQKCQWCHSPKYRTNKKYQFDHDRRTQFNLRGEHLKISKTAQGCYRCHTKARGINKPDRGCETCHGNDSPHRTRFDEFGKPPRCATCHSSSAWKTGQIFDHGKQTSFRLTGKHASITCRKCHRGNAPYKWERFDAKKVGCQNCHQHKNVHDGKFPDSKCRECHKDAGVKEINRNFALKEYHGPTSSFPLIRKHAGVECVLCHPNDMYEGTPTECGSRCHEDSLHRGSLGDECSRCHATGTWKALEFDHTDDTEWPLNGLHRTVPKCADCHPEPERDFANTPTNCSAVGCHAKDDAHQGKLGTRCENCHLESGDNIFDHNTQARFKLDGAHLTTKCSECHDDIKFKPAPVDCFGCHPEPSVHRGQYGTLCENCHSTTAWKKILPLHDVGDFSLRGMHDNQPCKRCHKDTRPLQGTGNFCINCHREDDVHSNSLSPRCGNCHTQWSFAPARFDHTTVGCYLTSIHRVLPCYDCHKTGNFRGLAPTCVSCHRDDAVRTGTAQGVDHLVQLNCSTCHSPNRWLPALGTESITAGYGRESICR